MADLKKYDLKNVKELQESLEAHAKGHQTLSGLGRHASHDPHLEGKKAANQSTVPRVKNSDSLVDVLEQIILGTQEWKNSQKILEYCYLISDNLLENMQKDKKDANNELKNLNQRLGGKVGKATVPRGPDVQSLASSKSQLSNKEANESNEIAAIAKQRRERTEQRARRFSRLHREKQMKQPGKPAWSTLKDQTEISRKGITGALRANSELVKSRYFVPTRIPQREVDLVKDIYYSGVKPQQQQTTEQPYLVEEGLHLDSQLGGDQRINLIVPDGGEYGPYHHRYVQDFVIDS